MWSNRLRRHALLLALTATSRAFGFSIRSHSLHQKFLSVSSTRLFAGDTPLVLPDFDSQEDYLKYMQGVAQLPKGFASGTANGKFVPDESPALGKLPIRATILHLTEGPTDSWAAVFTKNKYPGAPIIVGKSLLASGQPLEAIVINNKISNVCSENGVANAKLVCEAVQKALNCEAAVLPSSTGIIGWKLPAKELAAMIPDAIQDLQTESALTAASAIMTTDRFPKIRSATLPKSGARIVGIAKGAGMIEPNMATMLSYIMTDAVVSKQDLQTMLDDIVQTSFNAISVDSAESTSDTVVLMASNQVALEGDSLDDFKTALTNICQGLAADIVRNGEGTAHVMRLQVKNYPGSDLEARALGKFVVNSPLFKCAVSGNDPNTGRLAGAIGSFLGRLGGTPPDSSKLEITLGGRVIFASGQFVLEGDAVERELSQHMEDAGYDEVSTYPPHQRFVEIGVDFKSEGTGAATVLGSDLTSEYVAINADYRS